MDFREYGTALVLHAEQRVFAFEKVRHKEAEKVRLRVRKTLRGTVLNGLGRSNDTAYGCWSQATASDKLPHGIITFSLARIGINNGL